MIATNSGQYIHSALVKVSTKNDDNIIILLSVDNFSRLCFEPLLVKELTLKEIEKHFRQVLKEVRNKDVDISVKPKIFLSYGNIYVKYLNAEFDDECIFEFNPAVVDKITSTFAKTFLNQSPFDFTGK